MVSNSTWKQSPVVYYGYLDDVRVSIFKIESAFTSWGYGLKVYPEKVLNLSVALANRS